MTQNYFKKTTYKNLVLLSILTLTLTFVLSFNSYAQKQLLTKYNLDFEIGNVGETPAGWSMTNTVKKFGYEYALTDINKSQGLKSLNITHNGKKYFEDMYGSVYQGLDAVPFRGRKLVFSADVYFENSDDTTKVFLWMHEHFVDGSKGQFVISNMDSSKSPQWKRMQVELQVDNFVDYINYGFYLNGKGNMFVDNAKLEMISPFKTPNLSSIKLTQKQISNLYEFSNIFAKIGFFHPKQNIYESDKFSLIYNNINNIIEKTDGEQQNSKLDFDYNSKIEFYNNFFKKLDENITFYNPITLPKPNINKNQGINLLKKVYGEAYSLVNYGAYHNKISATAKTERNNIFGTQRSKEGVLIQVIDFAKLKLKSSLTQITVEAKSKMIKYSQGANAQIWARIDIDGQKESIYTTMKENPFTDSIWTGIKITMNVPNKAKALRVGLVLLGDGEAYFDDIKVTGVDATSKQIDLTVKNNGFQNGLENESPKDWEFTNVVRQAGYNVAVVDDAEARSKVLKIYSDKETFIQTPVLNQFVNCNISDSLSVYFPINVEEEYKDEKFVYPFELVETNDKDVISRIAAIIYTTSIINEFANAKNSNYKIDYQTFQNAVVEATKDIKNNEFEEILSYLASKIKDSGARVWNPEHTEKYSYPFLLKYNNGNVYVSYVGNINNLVKEIDTNSIKLKINTDELSKIKVGYRLQSINGKNLRMIFEELKNTIPNNNEEFLYTKMLAHIRASENVEVDKLEFLNENGESLKISVPKCFMVNKITQPRLEPIYELNPNLVYVDMTRISDEVFKYYLKDFKDTKYILFDLRGLSVMSEYFLGFFANKDIQSYNMELPIYSSPKDSDIEIQNSMKFKQVIKSLPEKLNSKLYFLIDEYTIGYSELIAQTIKNNNLGKLIGAKTAGGNSEIATLRLPCNYLFALPTLTVFNPKGENITSIPVSPDVEVKYDFKNNLEYDRNSETMDYLIKYAKDYINATNK